MQTEEQLDSVKNVVLIGMPGAGKSTLGIVLAKILGYDFMDADLVIQNQCDKTLQHIIDAMGPEGFIQVENQILSQIHTQTDTVIATGTVNSTTPLNVRKNAEISILQRDDVSNKDQVILDVDIDKKDKMKVRHIIIEGNKKLKRNKITGTFFKNGAFAKIHEAGKFKNFFRNIALENYRLNFSRTVTELEKV